MNHQAAPDGGQVANELLALAGKIQSANEIARPTLRRLSALMQSLDALISSPPQTPVDDDNGHLVIRQWAREINSEDGKLALHVDTAPRRVRMVGSPATGEPLMTNGHLGIDLIRLAGGTGFAPHTHPGDHLLLVVAGSGTVAYRGFLYPTRPGDVYLIEGSEPHAVGASTDHVILAVGTPHRAVDSPDRQNLVDYGAIAADLGTIYCLICKVSAHSPMTLLDVGCPHCPSQWVPHRPG